MKILLIADSEEKFLWENWTNATADMLADVDLVLSAGDLNHLYLEFIVTMLNVPLVYVRGNHDGYYDEKPPEGCEDADDRIVEVTCGSGSSMQRVRILGLGGSMRYRDDSADMYTEEEMSRRISKAERMIRKRRLTGAVKRFFVPDAKNAAVNTKACFDILLTHAPCRGYGDMEDLPHRGFECFNDLLNKYSPQLHCYGHVHHGYGMIRRQIAHPSGTLLINGSGHQIIDFGTP